MLMFSSVNFHELNIPVEPAPRWKTRTWASLQRPGTLSPEAGTLLAWFASFWMLYKWNCAIGTGFPGDASGKEPACQCRRRKRFGIAPQVGKIPWKRKWQSTPVFLPGASHGQRSLVGCSPWGYEELDTTKVRQTCSRHSVIYNFFCSTLWDSFIFYMSRETLLLSVVYRLRWVTHHSWFIHPIHWFQLLLWAF